MPHKTFGKEVILWTLTLFFVMKLESPRENCSDGVRKWWGIWEAVDMNSTCDDWMGELIKLIIWDLLCAQEETLFFSYFILSYLMGATKG
jgi:hypothetical protein